jgi:hypothetical protein
MPYHRLWKCLKFHFHYFGRKPTQANQFLEFLVASKPEVILKNDTRESLNPVWNSVSFSICKIKPDTALQAAISDLIQGINFGSCFPGRKFRPGKIWSLLDATWNPVGKYNSWISNREISFSKLYYFLIYIVNSVICKFTHQTPQFHLQYVRF